MKVARPLECNIHKSSNCCVKGRQIKGLDACDMVKVWRLKMF